MRYRLRTLLVLLALAPPLIGFWPAIKRHTLYRAAQINACDVVVVAAASWLIAFRVRLERVGSESATLPFREPADQREQRGDD